MDNKDFEKLYRDYLKVCNKKEVKELQKEKIKLKSEIKITLHPLMYLTALISVIGFCLGNIAVNNMFIGLSIGIIGIIALLAISQINHNKNKILTIKMDIIDIAIKDKEKNNDNNKNIRENKVKLMIKEKRKLMGIR